LVKDWDRKSLQVDYSSCNVGYGQPSDIDFFYVGKNHTLVLGEIKNEYGKFTKKQQELYREIADHHNADVIILYITHDKMVENGDEVVDIADCKVEAIYYNKESEKGFRKPTTQISVRDIIQYVS
jgi:site-specific DNA-adenine methylase